MYLPEAVQNCIRALEEAGHRAYCVGGCVRDALLGITPHDYDLCTSAAPAEIREIFRDYRLVRSGEKHGTIGVVTDAGVLEITTFRTEGDYRDGRHPDWVRFVGTVEEDLARRDFTVNAMAYAPREGYVDPWGGQKDLTQGVLRAVGDPTTRFTEDALRILRGVRFAVRFRLTPDPATLDAMIALAPLLDNLARERVFDELCKLLLLVNAQDLKTYAPILTRAIPQLAPSVDFQQHSPHHAYDVFTHIAHVVGAVPREPALRWAALLHDIGKPATFTQDETGRGHFKGHAQVSGQIADEVLHQLKAPTALREQVVFLVSHHMTPLEPDKKLLRRRLGRYGWEVVQNLLTLQQADFGSKGTGKDGDGSVFITIRQLLDEILSEDACLTIRDLAIDGRDLMGLGFAPSPALGHCLERLLCQVQDEMIPNSKDALLTAAAQILREETT